MQRLDHEARPASTEAPLSEGSETRAYSVLALLAQELPKLLAGDPGTASFHSVPTTNKRRRTDDGESRVSCAINGSDRDQNGVEKPVLPPPHALHMILEAYFVCIHPWIPMIHEARFRHRLTDPRERPKLDVVLHAIVLAASRFVRDQQYAVVSRSDQLRSWVISTAMDCMSVESLQALIILSFTDVSLGYRCCVSRGTCS